MDGSPVDPSLVLKDAAADDLVRRKLDMDALRKRLGDTATKQEKLRESCEGFEAIFLQKMWEQMRKTVPREGYLHSKDEETYQSMFDVELCKKMASAGGMGLADMLYEQLSQQLENTGRTTTPGSYRQFLPVPPADGLLPCAPGEKAPAAPSRACADRELTAETLYSPLAQEIPEPEPEPEAEPAGAALILGALNELQAELGTAPKDAPGAATRAWAADRHAASGLATVAERVDTANPSSVRNAAAPAGPDRSGLADAGRNTAAPGRADAGGVINGWQGPGPVSARPGSERLFGRDKNAGREKTAEARNKATVQPRGMAPEDTLWPLADNQGAVTGRFGWEDNPATGRRRWNSGVRISAAPDTPVRAVLPGTVVYAGQREGYGQTVVLEHKDGYRSYYSNLESVFVAIGDRIRHGAEFAKIAVQSSPSAKGENSASLHFELKKGEMALNPESAINRRAAVS